VRKHGAAAEADTWGWHRLGLVSWPVVLALLLAGPASGSGDGETVVSHRGRAVCLDDATLAPLDDEQRCNEPGGARFALATAVGDRVHFLADDPQAEIFRDPEVRARELVVEGWPRPGGQLELLHVYSLRDGRLYHLHYRCDLCNITAKAPGPCWCCRQPFELREVPVEEGGDATGRASAPTGSEG
jgi:hypothetical protein